MPVEEKQLTRASLSVEKVFISDALGGTDLTAFDHSFRKKQGIMSSI